MVSVRDPRILFAIPAVILKTSSDAPSFPPGLAFRVLDGVPLAAHDHFARVRGYSVNVRVRPRFPVRFLVLKLFGRHFRLPFVLR